MNQPELISRAPKRKRQPTAEVMREQLRLAADEIIRLRAELAGAEYSIETICTHFKVPLPWYRDPDQSGYGRITYRDDKPARPWYRRLFARTRTTTGTAAAMLSMENLT
jgi:hypothetical protein